MRPGLEPGVDPGAAFGAELGLKVGPAQRQSIGPVEPLAQLAARGLEGTSATAEAEVIFSTRTALSTLPAR